MSADRIIIGGADVTDAIKAIADAAPPLTPTQVDRLRNIFAPALAAIEAPHDADVQPLANPIRVRRERLSQAA